MAEILRYVDPNALTGGDGTTNELTGATRAYSSLSSWQAAQQQDLTDGGGDTARVVCSSDDAGSTHAEDTTLFAIDGWTTGVSNYITIEAASPHLSVWDDTIYRLWCNGGGGTAISVYENYTRIIGIQGGIHTYSAGFIYDTIGSTTNVLVSGCLIKGDNGHCGGIALYGAASIIVNNIIYDGINGISQTYTNSSYVYNNTVVDCVTGIAGHGSAVCRAKNNIVQGGTTCYLSSFHADSVGNISSDATSPNSALRSIALDFANAAGNDFHLAATDTEAIGAGTNLYNDAAYAFQTDIDGNDRGGAAASWDIGADEADEDAGTSIPGSFINLTRTLSSE